MQLPLKIMLVDDEIMALKNLKNLINWENSGYTVVTEETNPQKALTSFLKYRPQIILVDIKMPVMNGLEFSEKILALDLPVKIIILTSYKDFYYAKQAVEIGISSYLVKHELDKESLIHELEKLKRELFKEEKKDRIIRHRLIRALIDGRNPYDIVEEKISNRYINFDIGKIIFMFCRIDTPYPILKEPDTILNTQNDLCWSEINPGKGRKNIDIIELHSTEAVFVIYLESIHSINVVWKIINNTYSNIKSEFMELYGETITACPIIVNNLIKNMDNIYTKARILFEYSIFFGRGRIIDSDEIAIAKNNNETWQSENFKEFEKNLKDLDFDRVRGSLKNIFTLSKSSPWNPQEVKKTCNKLGSLLYDFLKNNLQSSVFGTNPENEILSGLENLYTIDDLLQWFDNKFSFAISRAKATDINQYSRKVRQTLDFIHLQYNKDWSVGEIAGSLSISSVYLRKLFKSETGTTIVQYLTDFRMEKSVNLLETGDYKVFEVAEMVGYNTSQYFSKVFKRHTEKSPMDYISGA